MTGWIIFGCIVLFFAVLLICSVRVNVVFEKNKLDYKIKYMFIKILPTSEKAMARKKKRAEKKAAKEAKKAEKKRQKEIRKNGGQAEEKAQPPAVSKPSDSGTPAENADDKPAQEENADGKDEKKPKKKMKIDFELIRQLVDSASPPVKRLIKHIRVNNVYIDWVVGGSDSAAVALKYGGVNAAVQSVLCWLDCAVRLHKKEINIEADFSKEKSDIFIYFDVKLRLSTALACGIWLMWRMLKMLIKRSTAKPVHMGAPAKARAKRT